MNLGSMQRGILRNGGILGGYVPVFGATVDTIEEAISTFSEPAAEDGDVLYLESTGGGTGAEDSAGGTWVVNYGGAPVPPVFDTITSFGNWIDTYSVPDGAITWVEDTGGSSGGFVTVEDGEPSTTPEVARRKPCFTSYNLNGFDPRVPARREEGSGMTFDFDSADVANTAEMDDPPP